jgi:predicted Fe-S protein YdhL (DUF1289 family)
MISQYKKISSPCTRLCKLDKDDICVGCGRTRIEIMLWHDMSEQRRLEIMGMLDARKIARYPNKHCETETFKP